MIPARVRQIYQEFIRSHRGSDRAQRWQWMLDHIEHAMVHGIRDHRGLQVAFEELEREYEARCR